MALEQMANAPAVAGGAITVGGIGLWIWRAAAAGGTGLAIWQTARINGIRKEATAAAEEANREELELERAKTQLAEEKARLAETRAQRAEIDAEQARLDAEQIDDGFNPFNGIDDLAEGAAALAVAAFVALWIRAEVRNWRARNA